MSSSTRPRPHDGTGRAPHTSGLRSADEASSARPVAHDRYLHEAFFWRGDEHFLARTVPFVLEGLEAGEPVMAAVVPRHVELLRPVWREFTDTHAGLGRPVRGIGEPVWSARRGSELAECQLHEALLNAAVAPATPLWLMCPYDADGLPEDVLAEARRSHPVVVEDVAPTESSYGGHGHIATLFAADLSPADPRVPVRDFQRGQLAAVRAEVESRAVSAGLRADQGQDLALAVHEVAVNSVEHGGGSGDIRVWEEPGALVVEVRDAGRIADPLVGRQLPARDDVGGRGLWLANQLCDLVQIRSRATGTTVRIHTWL